jgi:N-methylhydantoinase A
MSWHLGIDIGGTFTDAIAHQSASGTTRTAKVWTTKDDAQATINTVLAALDLRVPDVSMLTFGTTAITNAIIQRQLARVALLATAGFGDVLDIARQNRRVIYDIAALPREPSPVPAHLCFEVDARMGPDGHTLRAPDLNQVSQILADLGEAEAIAIALLHAYASGDHERAIAAVCRAHTAHVSQSHEVWPQLKEYERTLATVLNASVMPLVTRHVADLEACLSTGTRLELFHSAGGMMTPEAATVLPISLALSGPAAGVAAARAVARDAMAPLAISLDMGGTTTDVCLIVDGKPEIHEQTEVGPWTVNLPMLAVHSIGAGGGSLVSHGSAGLQVGPQSAGADPGPACYGRGGSAPTLTDAAVILGYLQPSEDPAAAVQIRIEAAKDALSGLAATLDMSIEQVARGVLRVANANMARALRRISVDRGVDTRECTLIAFGGAAPMFAAELARDIGMHTVVVPRNSSLLSAVGCLTTAPSYMRQRTVRLAGSQWDPQGYRDTCRAVAAEARENLLRGRAADSPVELGYLAFMRYLGQSYAIEVPCTPDSSRDDLRADFWRRHEALYGYHTEEPWEIQSLRVTAQMDAPGVSFPRLTPSDLPPRTLATVRCTFASGTAYTPIYQRQQLAPGPVLDGPLIVIDETSTTVVPPGCTLSVASPGHLLIDVRAPA